MGRCKWAMGWISNLLFANRTACYDNPDCSGCSNHDDLKIPKEAQK